MLEGAWLSDMSTAMEIRGIWVLVPVPIEAEAVPLLFIQHKMLKYHVLEEQVREPQALSFLRIVTTSLSHIPSDLLTSSLPYT